MAQARATREPVFARRFRCGHVSPTQHAAPPLGLLSQRPSPYSLPDNLIYTTLGCIPNSSTNSSPGRGTVLQSPRVRRSPTACRIHILVLLLDQPGSLCRHRGSESEMRALGSLRSQETSLVASGHLARLPGNRSFICHQGLSAPRGSAGSGDPKAVSRPCLGPKVSTSTTLPAHICSPHPPPPSRLLLVAFSVSPLGFCAPYYFSVQLTLTSRKRRDQMIGHHPV